MNPLVSIITPTYNSASYIDEMIKSVINQSYTNWELIIIDDCSTDNTKQVVNRYLSDDERIKYFVLEQNSGAAIARNTGIEEAQGELIAFLDSDDLWSPSKLKVQVEVMMQNNYDFTCTSYSKIDDTGQDIGVTIKTSKKKNYWSLLKDCPGNSTVMYNCEKLGKFFIPDIKKRNDYVMWLQIIKKAKNLYGIEEVLGYHRLRNGSLSQKKTDLVSYHWKVYRQIEELSMIKSSYLIGYWILKSVLK